MRPRFEVMVGRCGGIAFAAGAIAICLVGCGRDTFPLAPVRGVVTLDGKSFEGAMVSFIPPDAYTAGGVTDAQGRFVLACQGRPGCPTGRSRGLVAKQEIVLPVGVASDDRAAIEALPEGPKYIAVVPSQYGDL